MADKTAIEWAHSTFNPWEGCQKVGPGCDHCYAETRNARYNRGTAVNWGPGAPRRRTSVANWRKPLKWNREARISGRPHRVFCASLADVFDNAVDPQWRLDLAELIRATPYLTWMLLTKRIGNAGDMLSEMFPDGVPSNVWLGMTIVNQEEADRDWAKLKAACDYHRIQVPFLSIEPLLGYINLSRFAGWLKWIITGGESGPNARPMHPAWVRLIRRFCAHYGIAFFFKQWGEWKNGSDFKPDAKAVLDDGTVCDFTTGALSALDRESRLSARSPTLMRKVGKRAAGDLLDDVQYHEFPEAA